MRKITGSKLLLATFMPSVVVGSFALATSCSTDVIVSDKQPDVNKNTGIAEFEVELPEQPSDKQVMVSSITTSGNNPVLLIDENGSPYEGHPSTFYSVTNRKVKIRASFKDFSSKGASSRFDLHFSYLNKDKQYVNCQATGLELKVEYEHRETEEIHIFSLNDFHGAAAGFGDDYFTNVNSKNPGAIRIANEINPVIESHPGSFFVTAGDNTSGETFSTCVHAQSMFPVLSAMGARYSAVGNHAFEWGLDPLSSKQFDTLGRTEDTIGNYLVTANIILDPNKRDYEWEANPNDKKFLEDFQTWYSLIPSWADPYKIVNMNGHLVCLIGLTTQGTMVDGNKAVTEHLSFIDYEAAISYANYLCQKEMGETWYSAIESFVLLTHVESDTDGSVPTGQAAELAKKLQYFGGVDAVISGHSHKEVCGKVHNSKFNKDIWVGQAGTAGRKALDTKFYFNNNKPVGQRLDHISMDLKSFSIAQEYSKAQDELRQIRKHPNCPSVSNVVAAYEYQKKLVKEKLFSRVAVRKDALLYPICDSGKKIGHEYFCSDQIDDQLGAWICRCMLLGFTSYYLEDIKYAKNVTYPAISLFNIDSCNTQLLKPAKVPTEVTLKDIYAIQGYENPMYLGYLSVWQLANIIEYLLSGKDEFNYDMNREYYRIDTEVPAYPGRDLRKNYNSYLVDDASQTPIDCWYTDGRDWPTVDYKSGEKRGCAFLCGPLQWYGFRFDITEINDSTERDSYDRDYKLVYHAPDAEKYPEVAAKYAYVPNIWILDPMPTEEGGNPYLALDEPEKWQPAEFWLEQDRLIPCTINSFTYTKGNAQAAMIAEYFKYNQEVLGDIYKIANYSNLSREMIEEFCRLTQDPVWGKLVGFDLSNEIVRKLVRIAN